MVVIFYDNYVRDYLGAEYLKKCFIGSNIKSTVFPLWMFSHRFFSLFGGSSVVMGQIAEYSTSSIAHSLKKSGWKIFINTSETVTSLDKFKGFYCVNFQGTNDEMIDFQSLPNIEHLRFVQDNISQNNQYKYALTGVPRFDLYKKMDFFQVDVSARRKMAHGRKVVLYISSFIYDNEGGQISPENSKDLDRTLLKNQEEIRKKQTLESLERLISKFEADILFIIRKHPWDKSSSLNYFSKYGNVVMSNLCDAVYSEVLASDLVIHERSTVAVEAWLNNVKTVSFQPYNIMDKDESNFTHMAYEKVINNTRDLELILEDIQGYKSYGNRFVDENYVDLNDGRSTFRFVDAVKDKVQKNGLTKNLALSFGLRVLYGFFLLRGILRYRSLLGYEKLLINHEIVRLKKTKIIF